nr:hypothetical protein CFP56_12895 [Quercus suber]
MPKSRKKKVFEAPWPPFVDILSRALVHTQSIVSQSGHPNPGFTSKRLHSSSPFVLLSTSSLHASSPVSHPPTLPIFPDCSLRSSPPSLPIESTAMTDTVFSATEPAISNKSTRIHHLYFSPPKKERRDVFGVEGGAGDASKLQGNQQLAIRDGRAGGYGWMRSADGVVVVVDRGWKRMRVKKMMERQAAAGGENRGMMVVGRSILTTDRDSAFAMTRERAMHFDLDLDLDHCFQSCRFVMHAHRRTR